MSKKYLIAVLIVAVLVNVAWLVLRGMSSGSKPAAADPQPAPGAATSTSAGVPAATAAPGSRTVSTEAGILPTSVQVRSQEMPKAVRDLEARAAAALAAPKSAAPAGPTAATSTTDPAASPTDPAAAKAAAQRQQAAVQQAVAKDPVLGQFRQTPPMSMQSPKWDNGGKPAKVEVKQPPAVPPPAGTN